MAGVDVVGAGFVHGQRRLGLGREGVGAKSQGKGVDPNVVRLGGKRMGVC